MKNLSEIRWGILALGLAIGLVAALTMVVFVQV
jgi:hypothetical protein